MILLLEECIGKYHVHPEMTEDTYAATSWKVSQKFILPVAYITL